MKRDDQLTRIISRVRAFIARDENSSGFLELALEIFRFQFDRNVTYQRYCRALGKSPDDVQDWNEIPAVPTASFKETDWTVLPPGDRTTVFYSSGTTGTARSRHYHSAETLELYEDSLLKWFTQCVLPGSSPVQLEFLTPAPHEAPNSSLVHMFATLADAFGSGTFYGRLGDDDSWELDATGLFSAARSSEAPVVLCGTAFSFVHLCDWARENHRTLVLPKGSRVFETGGYKGRSRVVSKEELHRMIAEVCGIGPEAIICEYGMSELSSQAYDVRVGTNGGQVFRFPSWARVRIINPETGAEAGAGEPGLIRVYDLANVGSVMAVQTEDLGVRRGDGFELLGRAARAEARGCSLMPAA